MKLYGYNLKEKRKFVVDIEDICDCINMDYGFSDDYFVYVNEQDRDLHFNQNIQGINNKPTQKGKNNEL